MNKIRKILVGASAACVMACAAVAIAACGAPEHTHDFGDWTEKTAADCTHAQVLQRDCKDENCLGGGHEEKTGAAALSHEWGWNVTKPEGEGKGSASGVCARDGSHTATVELPELSSDKYAKTTTATCDTAGEATYTYTDPTYGNLSFKLDEESLGHDWKWEVTAPVGEDTGSANGVCKHDSSHTAKVDLPALSSSEYVKSEDTAQCLAPGEQLYTYTDATYGDVFFKVATNALGHDMPAAWTIDETNKKAVKECGNNCGHKDETNFDETVHVPSGNAIGAPETLSLNKTYYADCTKTLGFFVLDASAAGTYRFDFTEFSGQFFLNGVYLSKTAQGTASTSACVMFARSNSSNINTANGLAGEYVCEENDKHLVLNTADYAEQSNYGYIILSIKFDKAVSKNYDLQILLKATFTPAQVHNYVNWQVDVAPTDEDTGSARALCDKSCGDAGCEKVKSAALPALNDEAGAFYNKQRVEGEAGNPGKTVYTVSKAKADELFGGTQFSFELYDLPALTFGENTVALGTDAKTFTFTSAVAKEYSITVPAGVSVSYNTNDVITEESTDRAYNFSMSANSTVKFYLAATESGEVTVTIDNAKHKALSLGENTIDIPDSAANTFIVPDDWEEREYTFTFKVSNNIRQYMYMTVNDSNPEFTSNGLKPSKVDGAKQLSLFKFQSGSGDGWSYSYSPTTGFTVKVTLKAGDTVSFFSYQSHDEGVTLKVA